MNWRAGLIALALLARLAQAVPLEEAPAYLEGNEAFASSKFARARTLAEDLLKQDPNNYAALYLLGRVYLWGEGSVPRAYHCFDKAQRRLERLSDHPESGPSWKIYAQLLQDKATAAQQLEKYSEAMSLIDLYDKHFVPKHTAYKGWSLLKLGRADEARQLLLQLLDDPKHQSTRGHILNTLGNIEFESDNLEKALGHFQAISEEALASGDVDPVYWSNAAEAARDLLRYDEAEKLLLEATRHYSQYTYSNPWGMLADLYIHEGRLPEALEAAKNMQAWRISGSAQVSQNKWAECYGLAGNVLMQLGYDQEALNIFQRLLRRQDRNSSISSQATLVEARLVMFYAIAVQRNLERVRERLSYCSWGQFPGLLMQRLQLQRDWDRERARVANLISSNTGLYGFLQPYGARSLDYPSLAPHAWAFFGPGPVLATIHHSMKAGKPETAARIPYYLAVQGEAELHNFSPGQARLTLEKALAELPSQEVKLRRRCQAVLALALTQQGKVSEALHYLRQLMDNDPSQLRAVGLALPISIETDGGRAANQARSWLLHSPRLQRRNAAFVLKLQGDTGEVRGQLFGPDGTQLGQFRGQPRPQPQEAARHFCEVFHQEAFAPILDLSQVDINSINGSTGVARPKELDELGL